jgi:hypothetical protein
MNEIKSPEVSDTSDVSRTAIFCIALTAATTYKIYDSAA